MADSARSARFLRSAILAGVLAITGGCAATPPQTAAQAPAAPVASQAPSAGNSASAAAATPAFHGEDETPMSDTELVESAEFDTRVMREGYKPEVRDGTTVYCWTDNDIGTRIPTKKCVNRAQLEVMLQQRQAQRDAMQRTGGGCSPGVNCGN